jgi:prepilin-type processing-associated H-X9-DG protein
MPYYDQMSLYNKIAQYFPIANGPVPNTGMGWVTSYVGLPTPRQMAMTPIATLLCPSNEQTHVRRNQIIEPDGGGWNAPYADVAGGLDYVGNMGHIWAGWHDCGNVPDFPSTDGRFVRGSSGTPWISERWNNDNPNINGVFFFRGSRSISMIPDGTSNTVLLFESMHWRGGDGSGNPANFSYDHQDVANWASALGATCPMRHPINNRNPAWQYGSGDVRNWGPSSRHTGGCHVALCDGSVRFVSENIDHTVRYNIACARDNNPVGDF